MTEPATPTAGDHSEDYDAHDEARPRTAIADIRDYAAPVHLAAALADPAARAAAEERVCQLAREEQATGSDDDTRATSAAQVAERARLHVPQLLQQHLTQASFARTWTAEGTAVFLDVSGFTALSERLARGGREGAEQIADAIGKSFEAILLVAYDNGGNLLKFGGDAMLVWFDGAGHAARGARAAALMRRTLRSGGRIELPGARTTLRMSQGVHSGRFDFCAAGTTHIEFLPIGPTWTELVWLEHEAAPSQIRVSCATASRLPATCVGAPAGRGHVLLREPVSPRELPLVTRPTVAADLLARCFSPPLRAHVLGGGGMPEHRPVTIAFVGFNGTDALIRGRGLEATGDALHRLVEIVSTAATAHDVTFLGSDIDVNGGKLLLTAGAPRVIGDDEERMLLTLRDIVEAYPPLPVRIGVHRGAVFAGDIGPFYRRTYTVMGDVVNLAARLMANAKVGHVYATAQVLDASHTVFALDELTPLHVKGKTTPIRVWSVGRVRGSRARQIAAQRLPLIGRDAELGTARKALESARARGGCLLELVGEAGVGKTRLLEALGEEAGEVPLVHAVCEAYTASAPYALWRELLREILGFGRDDSDEDVERGLRALVDAQAPDVAPWLALLGIAMGLDLPSTPEIDLLTEKNRRERVHELVLRLLDVILREAALVIVENAQHMDAASAELLSYLAGEIASRPWMIAVARRPSKSGFISASGEAIVRLDIGPLSEATALALAQAHSENDPLPLHVLGACAERSGGNPQFLQDLIRAAMASGSLDGLPESAEAAAAARIDALAPRDSRWVRRAAVFGLTFHPRMVEWIADEEVGPAPPPEWWSGLGDFFQQEPDGYVHFRQSLLRDAAYEGLPYGLRRCLHKAIATKLSAEIHVADEAAGILSLHCYEAGDYDAAGRYAALAAKHAQTVYAYVEAAGLYARALAAGRRLPHLAPAELATLHEAQAESWYRAGAFAQAGAAYSAALRLTGGDRPKRSHLLLRRSWVEEKLGKYPRALRWAARARQAVEGANDADSLRQIARTTSWYASVLQLEGHTKDALRWARRAAEQAESADDPEALGEAYYVIGWAHGVLGDKGAEEFLQRSLEAYQRSGNLVRQAGLLSNLGVVCQWEGRWDEAMDYYERGRDDSLRIGSTIAAAVARINIAEILIDRGDVAEAEKLLRETLPLWKATRYHFFLGACMAQLGRAALRAGRSEDAQKRLADARASFEHVGAEAEVLEVDGLLAECRVGAGDLAGGLALAESILAKGSSPSVDKLRSQLCRVRAHALLRQGDVAAARTALDYSLAAARKRGALLDITLALLLRLDLDARDGVEPPADVVEETRALLARLKIASVRGYGLDGR